MTAEEESQERYPTCHDRPLMDTALMHALHGWKVVYTETHITDEATYGQGTEGSATHLDEVTTERHLTPEKLVCPRSLGWPEIRLWA